MSIKLNAQSGGSVALDAPTQTTNSEDKVYKLPVADGSAGQVLKTDGNGNLSWVTLPTGGLAVADTWRLTTTYDPGNGSADFITANWERDDTNGFGKVSGMTESSGVFTFPSTGIYNLLFIATYNMDPSGGDTVFAHIHTSTDGGSNYTKRTESGVGVGMGRPATSTTACLFDVTNTSTHKVKFATGSVHANSELLGSSSENKTYVMFTKLGET